MAIPFKVAGRGDLDGLFVGWSSGGNYGLTGHILGGYGDLGYRYQLIGAATPIAATGFRVGIGGPDFASLFLGVGAPTPPTFVPPVALTLTVGRPPTNPQNRSGYAATPAYGAISVSTLGAAQIREIFDFYIGGVTPSHHVMLYSATPISQSFFYSVVVGGVTKLASAASFYNSAPYYEWEWGGVIGIQGVNGSAYTYTFN